MEIAIQDYTAFSTPIGSFRWLRIASGLTGSPNIFSNHMGKFLEGLAWKFTIAYLDDCIKISCTINEHLQRLQDVFQRSEDAILKISTTKRYFCRNYPL